MLPIILDGSMVRAGLAGAGEGLTRRLKLLQAGGVMEPPVFADRLPLADEIAELQVLFIAGLDGASSRALAEVARKAGVLVNVEDMPELCDFHVPAQLRRGDLLVAVSTAGRSPALSRALREHLEGRFGPEWESRLDEIADLRNVWRAEGANPNEVSRRTRALLTEREWLA
jgi:precorrin-2 dehydrogenase/sirohydrochlorin ferrochelatase